MSFNNKKSVALQFVEEVLNKGNLNKIKNFVSPNIIWHGQYKQVKGLKSFKKWISLERSIFPDMRFSILDNVTEHDKVAVRWTLLATLKNKPTKHTKLQTTGLSIFQFEDDKIKEAWIAFDALGLALQLGVVDIVPSKVRKVKKVMIPFE